MLFNSIHFCLFFFFVTSAYFLFPHRFRWALLLMASCYFYAVFKPIYILILLVTIVVDYNAGFLIQSSQGWKRKMWLIISIIANIGFLVFFKYFNFLNENLTNLLGLAHVENPVPFLDIILPVGLSFHTFQALSYTIEVYRGNHPVEKHFGIYALYVMFYPQLVAGPIERPQNVLHQFHERHFFQLDEVIIGLRKMAWGMFKKVVVADRLAQYVNQVYGNPFDYQGIPLIIATTLFAFQIYCDFSGYSDIALGSARVMGFRLMKNFDRPYFALSIAEFWKRWHISLSTWFRDYLYIPLGGNRVRRSRWYFNLFITFLISGIWHGASWNFVIWGALHGTYLILALVCKPFWDWVGQFIGNFGSSWLWKAFNWIGTFVLVCLAWIFFRANHFSDAWYILTHLDHQISEGIKAIIWNSGNLRDHFLYAEKSKYHLFLGLAGIAIIIFVEFFQSKGSVQKRLDSFPTWARWLIYFVFAWYFILFGVFGANLQFTYFQF